MERLTFYAKGRHWLVFGYSGSAGSNHRHHKYCSSTDGITWTSPSTMCSAATWAGADLSVWIDGDDIHYVRSYLTASGGDPPTYRTVSYTHLRAHET